jgi:hypothetical protein
LRNFPWCLRLICGARRKGRKSRPEGLLHALGIGCRQFVLFGERPVRPKRGFVAASKFIDLAEKSIAQCRRRFRPQRGFAGI